jgi:hypothetical protein
MIYNSGVYREKPVLDNEEVNAQICDRYVSKISRRNFQHKAASIYPYVLKCRASSSKL